MRDRKQLRSHIRAAREWLGQADTSLEQENDVQGGLKLMLAKAELQRAEESAPLSKRRQWGIRFLPFLMAVLLAAAGLWFHSDMGMTVEQRTSSPAEIHSSVVVQEEASPADIVAEEGKAGDMPEFPAGNSAGQEGMFVAEPVLSAEPVRPSLVEQPRAEEQEKTDEVHGTRPRSGMPSEDMQKLMQSAGKVLRAGS